MLYLLETLIYGNIINLNTRINIFKCNILCKNILHLNMTLVDGIIYD